MNSTSDDCLKRIFDELDGFVRDNPIDEVDTLEDVRKYDENKKKKKQHVEQEYSDCLKTLSKTDAGKVRCAIAYLNGAVGRK